MKKEEVLKIENGIYRIYFEDGSDCLGSIGTESNGGKWIAPIDWDKPGCSKRSSWIGVRKLKPVIVKL